MKAISATLLVKWIGIGVVGGVGLAGAAAVATSPAPTASVSSQARASVPPVVAAPAQAPPGAGRDAARDAPQQVVIDAPIAETAPAAPRVSVTEPPSAAPAPELDFEIGAPLAAEVAYVDRARALLAAGRSDQGLAMLLSYEREFTEARLLPEVLFLRLETYDRLGRTNEARSAAQRLLDGFPKSPHASRARRFLRGEE